jgi:glycine/D-amino acid oxidase-like deaminating enzyme/nitrite reductase/ring-hydroxylating ferredoxin subunit
MTPAMRESQPDHPGGNTTSIWHGTVTVPTYPRLEQSAQTDVCIIGAGIAGLSVAYHLAREGKRVIVLDDGPIGGGESGRTTAHLTDAMDERFHWLERVHGPHGVRLAAESHGAAINRIQQIVQLESIDCDFERLDGYLLSNEPGNREELELDAAAAERAGMSDVALVERAPIASFDTGTALRFPSQGQFHILKYLSGVAEAITNKYGGAIHCDTHVEGVEGGDPCHVKLADGKQVTAGCVVVCTNASISDYVRTHIKIEPMRSYVVAAAIPRDAVERALYWEIGDPYYYARVVELSGTDAPNTGKAVYDALVVGGCDHKVGHDSNPEERWDTIERWMRERWPEAKDILYRWSGQILEPADGLAYIGRNPDGAENVFMATGDSGQGMTHGTIAGILLSDMVVGRKNPWETLYDPKRISLRAGPLREMAVHNADVAKQYAKGYLEPAEAASVDEIPAGEGRVLRRGVKRIAAYKDPDGNVTEKSAVCTHLKCIVEWNNMEKSWDCPCHGSRFATTGEVLNGPAIMPLDDVEPEIPRRKGAPRKRRAKA